MFLCRSHFLVLSLTVALCAAKAPGALAPSEFRSHDRWSVVGDSITQYGSYYAWVYLYYATRMPGLDLSVANCGISGDSAGGAIRRYNWDIKPTSPTVATIMLGMNDVDRDQYSDDPVNAEILSRREGALTNYRTNLEELAGRLRRDGARVIFVTPSPFDETADVAFPRHPGVNRALGECAQFMKTLAERDGAALIDLHGEMTRLNGQLQVKDPKFTLIGPDRVHPGIPGHLVMAYFFLRAQKAPAIVSRVSLDVPTRKVTAENAAIKNLSVAGNAMEFKCAESALPYPVPDVAKPALSWVPFQDELNQEILQISGLKTGRYMLSIDGERIDDFSAEKLSAGINLADFSGTPQLRQAREILALVQEWQQLIANAQRSIAEVEHWRLPDVAHPVSLEAVRSFLQSELERLKVDPNSHGQLDRDNIERYFIMKPREAATLARLKEIEAHIRTVARPRPHTYRLVPVTTRKLGASEWSVRSPDGTQEVVVSVKEGQLSYRLDRLREGKRIAVLASSPLGLKTDAGDFTENLVAKSVSDPIEVDESYEMITGKQRRLRNHYRVWTISLANRNGDPFGVEFRVYDDGLAFRYSLPKLPEHGTRVFAENTGFHLPSRGKAWMQPFQAIKPWAPAYEDFYTNGDPSGIDAPGPEGWAFPGLFETSGGWLLLTEANLDASYFGAHLDTKVRDCTYMIRLPLAESARGIGAAEATITTPWHGPWRVAINGSTLGTIATSSLVNHLSRKPADRDWSWVKPGRATWSWWSDHDSPRNFDRLKPFIDLAAEWGWEYSLIDANWNRMVSGNIEQLVAYAKQRGVGLLLWYNSGGDHNEVTEEPRGRLNDRPARRAEFAKLEALGVKGVKVDFFQSDKQWMIGHYLGILEDAADFHLLVDFHGCTIPRGWQRTYPNLVTMEAVRGAEIYGCCDEYGPGAVWQNTILPFTRNVVGSMDYTPVTFTNQKIPHQTTYAHELALSVLFESGVQHFADAVEGYKQLPDYAQAWLRAVPVAWDETRFVDGYPGKLAVLARRKGSSWYLAGIEGARQGRTLSLRLPFLTPGNYDVEIISDGADDRSFAHDRKTIVAGDTVNVTLRPAGGFVARISPR